jgi:hypothetical protein
MAAILAILFVGCPMLYLLYKVCLGLDDDEPREDKASGTSTVNITFDIRHTGKS